jgi:microcompartment protein CcmL/EutN
MALAALELGSWSAALLVLDTMDKTARVTLTQTELNDQPGVCLKCAGELADVEAAAAAATALAARMHVALACAVLPTPATSVDRAWTARPEFNLLIEQEAVQTPRAARREETNMAQPSGDALGLIETQGFTAVFEATDTAVKAASVEVVAREKLGGGYITVVFRGDVASVRAAVQAGAARASALGKLIAAHVIPSPSQAVLSLLPK